MMMTLFALKSTVVNMAVTYIGGLVVMDAPLTGQRGTHGQLPGSCTSGGDRLPALAYWPIAHRAYALPSCICPTLSTAF